MTLLSSAVLPTSSTEKGALTPADHFPGIQGLPWYPDAPLGQEGAPCLSLNHYLWSVSFVYYKSE